MTEMSSRSGGPSAGELEVDQRTDMPVADQDVAQVEVPVQQDVAAGVRRVPQLRQAPGRGVEHAVVGERELPGHRDQPEGRRGRQQHQLGAGAAQRIGICRRTRQHPGQVRGHRPGMQRPQQPGRFPGDVPQPGGRGPRAQAVERRVPAPRRPATTTAGHPRRSPGSPGPARPRGAGRAARPPGRGGPGPRATPPAGSRPPAATRRCYRWGPAGRRRPGTAACAPAAPGGARQTRCHTAQAGRRR